MKLLLFFVCLFFFSQAAPTDCNYKEENVLQVGTEIEEYETNSITLLYDPDCLLKKICTFTCNLHTLKPCNSVVYLSLPPTNPAYDKYDASCLLPKKKTIGGLYIQILGPIQSTLLLKFPLVSKLISRLVLGILSGSSSSLEEVYGKVLSVLSKGLSKVSPQDQVKAILGTDPKLSLVYSAVNLFLSQAYTVISQLCECSTLLKYTSLDIQNGIKQCEIISGNKLI